MTSVATPVVAGIWLFGGPAGPLVRCPESHSQESELLQAASILQAMPTLYVRDVPSELYERLRREAAAARRSLGAETIELLRRSLSPSHGVSLEQLLQGADRIRAQHSLPPGSPTAAELIREDRER